MRRRTPGPEPWPASAPWRSTSTTTRNRSHPPERRALGARESQRFERLSPAPTSRLETSSLAAAREAAERRAGETGEDPLAPELRAELLVEADRGRVPVEHRPLHPAAAAPHGDLRERPEERPAGAVAALRGQDEKVLEVERRRAEERGVREVVECQAEGRATPAADERLEVAPSAEAVTADPPGGRLHPVGEPLVLGEAADQPEDRGRVARRSVADRERGRNRSGPRDGEQHLHVAPRPRADVLEREPLVIAVHAMPLALEVEDERAPAVAVEPAAPEHPVVGEADEDFRHDDGAGRPAPDGVRERLVELGVGRREIRRLRLTGDRDLDPVVVDHAPDPGDDLLRVVAREHPAVDTGGRFGWDDISLLAAVKHRHGQRRADHRGVEAIREEAGAEGRVGQARREVVVPHARAPRQHSARMRRCGAVSGHGIEPWPGSLRAVRVSGSPVFSEIQMWRRGARKPAWTSIPPSSEIAYSAPASQSRRASATKRAP